MLDLDETGQIREARIALGGVAHKPWRREEAEAILIDTEPTESNFMKAADSLLDGARSYGMHGTNGFKIPMAKRAIVRALLIATSGTPNHAHEESV